MTRWSRLTSDGRPLAMTFPNAITMTLSAADASTHLLENPYAPSFLHGHQLVVTLVLLAALAAVFLRGFSEAIGIAVVLVGVYLTLNAIVVGDALVHVATGSHQVTDWWSALTTQHSSALAVIGVARLRYRPRTRKTAAWFAMGKERCQAWNAVYEKISRDIATAGATAA